MPPGPPRLVVATNIYALQWVVQRVGGEHVDVRRLEGEVHDPGAVSPHDRDLLRDADLVVYVGDASPSVQTLLNEKPEPNRVKDVARLPGIVLRDADPELRDEALADNKDPHVWLDPRGRMTSIINETQRALVGATERDERFHGQRIDFSKVFDDNARTLVRDLRDLDQVLDSRLRICLGRAIVAEHPAFGYLAEAYGLRQLAVAKPDGRPLPPEDDELQRQRLRVEWDNTTERTIFLDRSRSGETPSPARDYVDHLANQLDVRYRYLETLEDDPMTTPEGEARDYLQVMVDNMNTIKEGLGCL